MDFILKGVVEVFKKMYGLSYVSKCVHLLFLLWTDFIFP